MPGENHEPGTKNSSSIIRFTHHKMYVTECELTYHEMLSVRNLSKKLSGQ